MGYSDQKRKEIFNFFQKNGMSETCKHFNVKEETVSREVRREKQNNLEFFDFEREEEDSKVSIKLKSHELKTIDELLAYAKIDTTIWEPFKVITNSWGSETNPCYQIKAWLKKIENIDEIKSIEETCKNIENILKDKGPVSNRKKTASEKESFLWEIGLVDHHLGQFSWKEEVGFNYDIKIAQKLYYDAVEFLIDNIKPYKINKILYHFGQDFFNVNSQFNQTVAGTPQQEEGRWQKSFEKGVETHIKAINELKKIAPVDAIQIIGNHDEERIQYAAAVLRAWFRNDKNVNIDDRPISRKYYKYGKNLIGFTHGDKIKIDRLLGLMPIEAKNWWSQCENFEWHTGHVHHKEIKKYLDEKNGITVRSLPTLVPVDAWHFHQGYLKSRETQSFLWHHDMGNVIQINYRV